MSRYNTGIYSWDTRLLPGARCRGGSEKMAPEHTLHPRGAPGERGGCPESARQGACGVPRRCHVLVIWLGPWLVLRFFVYLSNTHPPLRVRERGRSHNGSEALFKERPLWPGFITVKVFT